MPYIKQEFRSFIDKGCAPKNCGELNYKFSMIVNQYVKDKGLSYQTINDILGAFSGAEKEFYRRVGGPHEDIKIKENGDVYDCLRRD